MSNENIAERISKVAEKERQKIAHTAEKSRKTNKWVMMFICVFLIALGGAGAIFEIPIISDYAGFIAIAGAVLFIITGVVL